MKKIFSVILLTSVSLTFCQSKISGSIVNESNEPIAFASVVLLEEKNGVSSDVNGLFEFNNLKEGEYKIRFSYIGFATKTDKVTLKQNENKIRKLLRIVFWLRKERIEEN